MNPENHPVSSALRELEKIPTGTRIFNYGFDQSPALVNLYHSLIGGDFIPAQSAKDWWEGDFFEVDRMYSKCTNPERGDIFVARGGKYSQPYGHMGVVLDVISPGKIATIEQNGGTRWVNYYTRTLENILGFLRPKPLANHPRTE